MKSTHNSLSRCVTIGIDDRQRFNFVFFLLSFNWNVVNYNLIQFGSGISCYFAFTFGSFGICRHVSFAAVSFLLSFGFVLSCSIFFPLLRQFDVVWLVMPRRNLVFIGIDI